MIGKVSVSLYMIITKFYITEIKILTQERANSKRVQATKIFTERLANIVNFLFHHFFALHFNQK